jgi:thiamine-phosphate diphosphorylase
LRVYVITDQALARGRSQAALVAQALEGGATAVQLRWKSGPLRDAVELGRALRQLCRAAGALFIVNDRLDLALAVEADGVHLGVTDLPVAEARRLASDDLVIGFSPETLEQAQQAEAAGADYLGVGPIYATTTKPDAGAPVGVAQVQAIVQRVQIPVVGIGGITAANAAEVIRAGAAGVAVIAAVFGAEDVRGATAALRQVVDAALGERGT